MAFTPYNPDKTVHRHRLNLPHWSQSGRTYFITTRLADSVPSTVRDHWLQQRETWLSQRGMPSDVNPDQLPEAERNDFHREFTARFHELFDAGHGECVLGRSDSAKILSEVLTSGHGTTYHLDGWVVMPNHFHALVEPAGENALSGILKVWKGSSARKINGVCGKSGSLWQAEAFDHIVRSEKQLCHFRRYIAWNPAKAGLLDGFVLGFGNRIGVSPAEFLQE